MKKIFILLMIPFLVWCTSCGKKITTYTEINYQQYLDKIESKDSFPLVIGSEECSACAIYKVTMEMFIEKHQVEVFFIDISKLEKEDLQKLNSQISYDGTPTTVFIEEGNLTSYYNRIDGAKDLLVVEDRFRINKYID